MDAFGYVSVILSVVIGLGLSHLLTGWPKRAPGFVSTGYTSAGFLVSKGEPDKAIDLRAYFYENRGGFFGTSAAFTALLSVENWLLTGRGSPATVTATLVVCIVLPDASAVVKSTRYHAAVALLFVALFLAFILMFGLRLGAH